MNRNSMTSPAATPVIIPERAHVERPTSPEIVALMNQVASLLQENQPKRALDAITRSKSNSPWALNALGVCQLRLGNSRVAVDILRGLVLTGGIYLRTDVPAVFKANFVAAMLMTENMKSGASMLAGMSEKDHPAVGKLKSAIATWKQGLTWAQKINWYLGGQPNHPFAPDFPLGDLE
jgi:hypothetical protein